MRSFFSVSALFLAASVALAQNEFTIDTPSNAVVCQTVLINWRGGMPPYYLSVLPGSQPGGTAIESFPPNLGHSQIWDVDIAAGTQVGLTLRDGTGAFTQSAPFTINPGPIYRSAVEKWPRVASLFLN
ncbi:hypothetical protein F5887DRAFT_919664 [Amanita rubescens]|nr:hypothetical protein F5887DRAFT_919664 [Amanita rubescens]